MTYDRKTAPDGANDQDKHGRKQNSGTNESSLRGRGSRRGFFNDGADEDLSEPDKQPRKADRPDGNDAG
jgi:hypothetical protein